MAKAPDPIFWRDTRMPHVELRKVADGRKVCYAPHSHTQWSLGAITGGESSFQYREDYYHVHAGSLVLMNPDWVHTCNPINDQPWSYLMLYVDTPWLTRLRHEAGLLPTLEWQDIATPVLVDPEQFDAFCALGESLLDPARDLLDKQLCVVEFLSGLMATVTGEGVLTPQVGTGNLQPLADYLDQHCTEELSLDALCERSGFSPGHLIRSFRQQFGMTPHAYIVNRRIQYGQRRLRAGVDIAEAALQAGFSDQSHFQRTFKRLVAATPGQYQRPSRDEQKDTTPRQQDGETAVDSP